MKIILVATLGGDLVRSTEHVGLGYLSAYLKQHNHEVQTIEVKEENIFHCETYLDQFSKCDLVGFTTTCITMKSVAQIAFEIKKRYGSLHISCGGHMATFSGYDILQMYPQFDSVIRGEGEITFSELAEALESKRDLSGIKGISYRKDGRVVQNEDRALISNLDSLPFPDRDQFELHNRNFQYLRISSSRGCLGHCGFCSSFVGRTQKGPRWRGRSPKNVVDEIETLVNKYNFRTFDFVDSTFEDPGKEGKQRIREIALEIINRGLKIYYNCCFRAENWSGADAELLELLIQSGLEKVNIGFESGNDKGLKVLNKIATMEDNWRSIHVLKNFPMIYVTFGFIMLHPYSSLQDLKDNAAFLHGTGIGQVIRHYFWMLEVYPNTLLEQKLKKDGLLSKGYDINDGMYQYKFLLPEVEYLVNIFKDMLTLKSVWDFEIFDIQLHTFITRLQRIYSGTPVAEEINGFSALADQHRKKIADFNYQFFMELLACGRGMKTDYLKRELDCFILGQMNEIKAKQYQLGLSLRRRGYEMKLK